MDQPVSLQSFKHTACWCYFCSSNIPVGAYPPHITQDVSLYDIVLILIALPLFTCLQESPVMDLCIPCNDCHLYLFVQC